MKSDDKLKIAGVLVGSLFTMAPVMAYIVGALRTASLVKQSGISDSQGIAERMGEMMYMVIGGVILCPIGLVILAVTASAYFKDRKSNQQPKASLPPPLPPVQLPQ